MTQPALAIVRAWQEKSAKASIRSKDRLFAAVNKGFDAVAALLAKDSDPADVQCALEYLSSDRCLALKFDKSKDDSLRDLVYGLLESMHVSLNEWNEERIQRKDTGEIFTQTEDYTISVLGPINSSYEASNPMDNHSSNNASTHSNPSPAIPIEPKEEPIDIHQSLPQDFQIFASELMRDEEMIMKEEIDNQYSDPIFPDSMDGISTNADFTRSLLPFIPREEPRDQTVPEDKQMQSLLFPPPSIIPPQEAVPIDFVHPSENMSTMGNVTPSNPKMKKEELMETQEVHNDNEIESIEENQNDNEMQPSDFMDNPMNFGDEIFDDRDLVLANPSNEISMSTNDMDESGQRQILEDGRDSLENDLIDNEGEKDEPVDTPKGTDSVKVEKRKRSSRRASRPMQYAEPMGDSDDAESDSSMKKPRADSMRKDDNRKSIKGEEKSGSASKKLIVAKENATDLECPECEYSTRIVKTWMTHLRRKHSTSPDLAGLALLCECGDESLSEKHSLKCNYGNTTVIRKKDGPIGRFDDQKVTPKCVLCEAYPKTARGYSAHLQNHHKSTLAENGIYLMCSCGLEVLSDFSRKHFEKCDPRQLTLHKLDDE